MAMLQDSCLYFIYRKKITQNVYVKNVIDKKQMK